MRTYNKIIRFYDSWFADLEDPDKELSGEEKWSVIRAICECQRVGKHEPLDALPLAVRRALQMSTLKEQIERMLERSDRMRARGAAGGQAARAARAQEVAAQDIQNKELKEQLARKKQEDDFRALQDWQREELVAQNVTSSDGHVLVGRSLAYYKIMSSWGL